MITLSRTIALLTILLLPFIGAAQGIVAGIAGPGDIYTDIVPDSVFQAAPVHLSPFPGGEISIDIDHNGTPDLELGEYGNGGLGGGGGSGYIAPLGPDVFILSHPDTSLVYPGVPAVSYVADTLDEGVIIGSNPEFRNRRAVFWSEYYGASAGPNVQTWVNIGDHYAGVALAIPGDTLYGWVRVSIATGGGAYIMTLSEYACNINPNAVPGIGQGKTLRVYPNPFSDSFTVHVPGQISRGEIIVTDMAGNCVLQQPMTANPCTVSAPGLPHGMYFLHAETMEGKWTAKLVKN